MWTKDFWAQVMERAVKTFAQAAVALLAGDGLGLLTVHWRHVGSVAALAALTSVLTSVASGPIGRDGTPSLVAGPGDRTADRLGARLRAMVVASDRVLDATTSAHDVLEQTLRARSREAHEVLVRAGQWWPR